MNRKRPRTCVGCGEESPRRELMRIVRMPDGSIKYDPTGKANGRGAYICRSLECVQLARKKNALARALKTKTDAALYDELETLCRGGSDEKSEK